MIHASFATQNRNPALRIMAVSVGSLSIQPAFQEAVVRVSGACHRPFRNLTACRAFFETLRDSAAESYREATGSVWRPRFGSHVSQTGKLPCTAINARDFQRAQKDRETLAHLPQGTLAATPHPPLTRVAGHRTHR